MVIFWLKKIHFSKEKENMERLEEYFDSTGVRTSWFAHKCGMNPKHLSQAIAGLRPIPVRFWKSIILISGGKITLEDFLRYTFRDTEDFEFKSNSSSTKCTISLKDFNKKD